MIDLQYQLQYQMGNIRKVTQELNNHSNVNRKSADIEDKGAPSGIIFDPITGNCSG